MHSSLLLSPAGGLPVQLSDAAAAAGGAAALPADLVPEAPASGPLMPRPQGRGLTVIVLGPPGAGASTQAAQIGAHYGAPVLTVNDVVQWARSGAGGRTLAEQVREYVKRPSYGGADDKALDELSALARAGKVAVPKPLAPAPPGGGGKGGKDAGAKLGGTAGVADLGSSAKAAGKKGAGAEPVATTCPRLPQAVVVEALKARLLRADAAFAAIIDGVRCDYLADDMETAGAVRLALAAVGGPLRIVLLEANEYALSHRYCAAMQVRPLPSRSCSRRLSMHAAPLTCDLPRVLTSSSTSRCRRH